MNEIQEALYPKECVEKAYDNGYKAAEEKYRGAVLVAEEYRKRLEAIEEDECWEEWEERDGCKR